MMVGAWRSTVRVHKHLAAAVRSQAPRQWVVGSKRGSMSVGPTTLWCHFSLLGPLPLDNSRVSGNVNQGREMAVPVTEIERLDAP